MFNDINLFEQKTLQQLEPPGYITTASGHCFAYAIGKVPFSRVYKGKRYATYLTNVLYVPNLPINLFSVTAMNDRGFTVEFRKGEVLITHPNVDPVVGYLKDGHWNLPIKLLNHLSSSVSSPPLENKGNHDLSAFMSKEELWHRKLGHISRERIIKMAKGAADGVPYNLATFNIPFCEACTLGKQHKEPIRKEPHTRAATPLDRIFIDLAGPTSTESIGGSRYFMGVTDDYSQYGWVKFLCKKSNAKNVLIDLVTLIERESQRKLAIIRCDSGGEWINNDLQAWARSKGIKFEFTAPYSPHQNGTSERKNRTLLDMARTLLIQAKLSPGFWAEAIRMAQILHNFAPSSSIDFDSPYHKWWRKKPSVHDLHVFGCAAYSMNEQHKTKFEPRSIFTRYMGPAIDGAGHRLWNPSTHKIINSRNVIFRDQDFPEKTPINTIPGMPTATNEVDSVNQFTWEPELTITTTTTSSTLSSPTTFPTTSNFDSQSTPPIHISDTESTVSTNVYSKSPNTNQTFSSSPSTNNQQNINNITSNTSTNAKSPLSTPYIPPTSSATSSTISLQKPAIKTTSPNTTSNDSKIIPRVLFHDPPTISAPNSNLSNLHRRLRGRNK